MWSTVWDVPLPSLLHTEKLIAISSVLWCSIMQSDHSNQQLCEEHVPQLKGKWQLASR
jgi:hypothetical protein